MINFYQGKWRGPRIESRWDRPCALVTVSQPDVKRTVCALITHPYLATRLSTAIGAPPPRICVFNGTGNTALFAFLCSCTASLFTCYQGYRM